MSIDDERAPKTMQRASIFAFSRCNRTSATKELYVGIRIYINGS
jgi:hypothetical protein